MKTYLASLLRHAFTALAGLGAFLLSHNLIDQGDVAAVDAAGVSLGAALVVILTAIIGRMALTIFGKFFAGAAGENGGASGGAASLLLWAGTAAGFMGGLPSCSPADRASAWAAFRAVPIRACVAGEYGSACYSSKGGIELTVDTKSGK
jgi:hypothetical protein